MKLAALGPLILLSGCITATTPEAFCRERVEAECRKEASCQGRTDWQSCVVSREKSCEAETDASLCGAGKKYDPAKGQECIAGYAEAACAGLSQGDRPAACFESCTAG